MTTRVTEHLPRLALEAMRAFVDMVAPAGPFMRMVQSFEARDVFSRMEYATVDVDIDRFDASADRIGDVLRAAARHLGDYTRNARPLMFVRPDALSAAFPREHQRVLIDEVVQTVLLVRVEYDVQRARERVVLETRMLGCEHRQIERVPLATFTLNEDRLIRLPKE